MWHTLTSGHTHTHTPSQNVQVQKHTDWRAKNTTPRHLHTHIPFIWCCVSIWHYLWHTNKDANTCVHTLMQALSRLLHYGARAEASGLSGNRSFISCLSSPQKTMVVCVYVFVCVCVGHVPMCDYSSCRHDEHMILCVCVCVCVSFHICTGRILFYSERLQAGAAIIIFSPAFFPSVCHFFVSHWLTKQSRTAKYQTWALGLRHVNADTHVRPSLTQQIRTAVINLHYALSQWSRNTQTLTLIIINWAVRILDQMNCTMRIDAANL